MRTAITLMMLGMMSFATAAETQINLSWDDCGGAGTERKPFACDTNAGAPFSLVASFKPPVSTTSFNGLDAVIDALAVGDSLPTWWQFGSGGCRGLSGLTTTADFTAGPFACVDPFSGQAFANMLFTPMGLNGARIRVVVGLPSATSLDPDLEHYAFKLVFSRLRTTGISACAGCSTPVCMILEQITVYQESGPASPLTSPLDRQTASWQNAFLAIYDDPPHGGGFICVPDVPVRSARTTWGAVKSLYR